MLDGSIERERVQRVAAERVPVVEERNYEGDFIPSLVIVGGAILLFIGISLIKKK